MTEECRSCRWWVGATSNGTPTGNGDCHRYPPQFCIYVWSEETEYSNQQRMRSETEWYYPTTDDFDFCGEFNEQKESAP